MFGKNEVLLSWWCRRLVNWIIPFWTGLESTLRWRILGSGGHKAWTFTLFVLPHGTGRRNGTDRSILLSATASKLGEKFPWDCLFFQRLLSYITRRVKWTLNMEFIITTRKWNMMGRYTSSLHLATRIQTSDFVNFCKNSILSLSQNPPLRRNRPGTPIPVFKVVDLGVQTDNVFSPSAQCTEAANKAVWLIFMVRRSFQDLS